MTMLGPSSKREITRTSIRVRTAMAEQTRQGRYLGRSPAHPALVSGQDFIAVQAVKAARGPAPRADPGLPADTRRYRLAGLLIGYLREHLVTLTWDQAAASLRAGTHEAVTIRAS